MMTVCCTFAVFNMQIARAKPSMLNMVAGVLIPQLSRHVPVLVSAFNILFLQVSVHINLSCRRSIQNCCFINNALPLRHIHVLYMHVTEDVRHFVLAISLHLSPE